jgi:signal transduction histidine kinase
VSAGRSGPESPGVDRSLWRALAAFRVASLGYAAVRYLAVYDDYAHPYAGWAVLVAMAVWTSVTVLVLRRPGGRRWPVLWLDLALAALAVAATAWLDDPGRIAAGAQTLPVTWAAAPVLAFAARGGARAGALAAAVIAAADVVHRGSLLDPRGDVAGATVHNIVLLVLLGTIVGYLVGLAHDGERALARALEVDAASAERERLARDIHDGVLQVLALVERRGADAGGEAAELGRLAGEQQAALRALIGSRRVPVQADGEQPARDLGALLAVLATGHVSVAGPATAVLLPACTAQEVTAAVVAALDNVSRHAGPDTRAWVLVEDDLAEVVVSVRDDGVGMPAGRLAQAEREGRLGVAQSIRGRIEALGGTAVITTAPGRGTEVELRVPRVRGGVRTGG